MSVVAIAMKITVMTLPAMSVAAPLFSIAIPRGIRPAIRATVFYPIAWYTSSKVSTTAITIASAQAKDRFN